MIRSILTILVVISGVSYGLVVSRHVEEGSMLYPGKVLGDELEYRLTPGDENKARLKLDRLSDKALEVKKDRIANNTAEEQKDQQAFDKLATEIEKDIEKLA